jgi:hypothetical protein
VANVSQGTSCLRLDILAHGRLEVVVRISNCLGHAPEFHSLFDGLSVIGNRLAGIPYGFVVELHAKLGRSELGELVGERLEVVSELLLATSRIWPSRRFSSSASGSGESAPGTDAKFIALSTNWTPTLRKWADPEGANARGHDGRGTPRTDSG